MTYTRHGHRIPNSPMDPGPAWSIVQCGGPKVCGVCQDDVKEFLETLDQSGTIPPFTTHADAGEFMTKAMSHVSLLIESRLDKTDDPAEFGVYVVWFSKTLQNWKALISSTLNDGKYYEVTYNGDKKVTYVDTYVKVDNTELPDPPA